MLHKLKIISYSLIILFVLILPSQADEYCTTADMCAAAAQAAGKMLGNEGKNGISGYPFVLETNTYGCWYYPDSHPNKNYAGSAFWGAASSEAQMRDPDPGSAHHVRLKCEGGGPAQTIMEAAPVIAAPEAQVAAPGMPIQADEYCTTEDMCATAAEAAGLRLGNDSYDFALPTNTYGCWYYPASHASDEYRLTAFWGVQSSEEQMRDPDPGAAHNVRLKCSPAAAEEVMDEIKAHNICDAKAKTYVGEKVNPRYDRDLTYADFMTMVKQNWRGPQTEAVVEGYVNYFTNCMAGGYYKFDPRWNNN